MDFFNAFLDKDTIHTLTLNQKIIASLIVTVLGMGITFVGLIAIQYMIQLSSFFVRGVENKMNDKGNDKKPPAAKTEFVVVEPKEVSVDPNELTEEIIAIITAAIAASLETHTSNIVVKNIRRVGQITPAWSVAGRVEQLGSRF